MTTNLFTISLFLCFFICSGFNNSVNFRDENPYSPKLLIHYTIEELDEMLVESPEKYNAIVYYHLHSYTIEPLDADIEPSIDLSTFDITPYERFRHQSIQITKTDWKKGIKIILIPIDLMEYKLPIHLQRNNSTSDEDYDFEN